MVDMRKMIALIDYHKILHSNLSKAECMYRVYRAFAEDRALSLTPILTTEDDISFRVKYPDVFGHNSFLPKVRIAFAQMEGGTRIEAVFSLQMPSGVWGWIGCCFIGLVLTAFVLAFFYTWFVQGVFMWQFPVVMVGMLCVCFVMAFVGLRFSSGDILSVITDAVKEKVQ